MKEVEPEKDYSIVSYLVQHQFHVLETLNSQLYRKDTVEMLSRPANRLHCFKTNTTSNS